MRLCFSGLFIAFAACTSFFATANAGQDHLLPDLGSPSSSSLPYSKEKALGKEFIHEIRQRAHIIYDPYVENYIQQLGKKIQSFTNSHQQPFYFFTVNADSINAFAGPDGYVGIHSQLFLTTETESELAGVLAHEIAHVQQKHIARRFESNDKLTLPMIAGILASIALATQNPEAGSAGVAATMAGSTQASINEIRQYEKEADRLGIQLLQDAGFDPRGMPDFFARMHKASHAYQQSSIPEILLTHPVTQARISDALNRIQQIDNPKQHESSAEYHIAKVRLQFLSNRNIQELKNYFKHDNSQYGRYGYTLALIAQRELDEALVIARSLFNNEPTISAYRILLSTIFKEQGNIAKAIEVLNDGLRLAPHDHPLNMQLAKLLLNSERPAEARQLLLEHLRRQPKSPALYELLSEAQGKANYLAEAHLSRAEALYLNGYLEDAIKQLKYAEQQKNAHPSTLAEIMTRKEQMAAELEEHDKLF